MKKGCILGLALSTIAILLDNEGFAQWVQTDGPYGGQINSLVSIGSEIFTCAGGAVWYSTNNGTTWNATGLTDAGVSAIADEDNKLIAIGSEVLVYLDKDSRWIVTGSRLPWINLQLLAASNTTLFVSANNGLALALGGRDLFAATDYVLYVSTDNGAGWSPTGLNTSTISSNTWIYSLAVGTDATDGLDIFAGTSDHGVLVSKDGGATWSASNAGLTDLCIYSLAVSGSYLFAGTNVSGVWKRPLSELAATYGPFSGKTPQGFSLNQNYPNPFNPTTIISYQLLMNGHVSLQVFDVLGRLVKTLVDKVEHPGNYTVTFDASGLPSGVYLYRLQAGSYRDLKKLLLLK